MEETVSMRSGRARVQDRVIEPNHSEITMQLPGPVPRVKVTSQRVINSLLLIVTICPACNQDGNSSGKRLPQLCWALRHGQIGIQTNPDPTLLACSYITTSKAVGKITRDLVTS
ncbi:hypothetical protein TEQG_06699 [Trichophyton equinum CBS 127.97]|uniref:Uncharacterized protein n=1 Tax=Trichophyton equinum (strain ATCC MYA-4606 / CBS 127.97) TaxID=559882 RepID=F2Q0P8_TRIEC|nr:hypothetical protein TEQG_06699 [Trichophyton equinum CBS 127.97]